MACQFHYETLECLMVYRLFYYSNINKAVECLMSSAFILLFEREAVS